MRADGIGVILAAESGLYPMLLYPAVDRVV